MDSENQKRFTLVLLTQNYPFLPGEQFLETEIKYLSEQFKEIHIIPAWVMDANQPKRQVPDNVVVHTLQDFGASPIGLFQRMKNALFDRQARRLFLKDFKTARGKGRKAVTRLLNWLGIAVRIRNALRVFIDSHLQGNMKDCIFYSYWTSPVALALKMIKEENRDMAVVSRAHGGDLYEYRQNPHYLPLQSEVVKSLDRLFLISQDGFRYLSKKNPDLKDRLSISRLGTLNDGRRSKFSEDGVLRIVTCSYLRPVKRVELLAAALQKSTIPIEWTHIGEGPLKQDILNRAKQFPDNIKYQFPGALKNDQVLQYYSDHSVDVFINVSKSEGLPVTIMEAFSFGIPVIATNVGGTSELVNEETGILLDRDIDAVELAYAIEAFAGLSLEKKGQMSRHAFEKWSRNFNAERNYTDFANQLIGIGDRVHNG